MTSIEYKNDIESNFTRISNDNPNPSLTLSSNPNPNPNPNPSPSLSLSSNPSPSLSLSSNPSPNPNPNPNPSSNSKTSLSPSLRTIPIYNQNRTTISIKSNNDITGIYCLKSIIIFVILLFGLPLTICDLYYGFTDDSCVSSHVDRINVNLKQYLQVSGLLTGCFIFLLILLILINEENSKGFLLRLGTILYLFISIFNNVWNIIGGVIFWGYMDNSLCSNSIFNYVFASLIIKYVCCAFGLFSNNKKKD